MKIYTKRALYVLIDLTLALTATLTSAWLLDIDTSRLYSLEKGLLYFSPILAVIVFYIMGLYDTVLRYLSFKAVFVVAKSVTLFGVLLSCVFFFLTPNIPTKTAFLIWLICLLLVGTGRLIRSWYLTYSGVRYGLQREKRNVLIYGAGTAGVQLAMLLSYGNQRVTMGFIDDSLDLHDKIIEGHPVYSNKQIQHLIDNLKIEEILLAIPSASRTRRKRILKILEPYKVHVRSLPSLEEIVNCEVKVDDIREVELRDLLGRESVPANTDLIRAPISHKVVMVTGAAGSIGSELCRQIVKLSPSIVILYEQHEFSLYQLDNELADLDFNGELVSVLGSVLDSNRVQHVIHKYNVNTVFHAAAYKHVPMVERNPIAGARNNIIGTYTVAKSALNSSINSFVLISTDKAVRPTNVMGATKRVAELIIQAMDEMSQTTNFSAVRFGNVIGSSGSVIPRFREQIKSGGPVTVTHPDITRYFMTLSEAAQLVIQAGALATGGDVFVLDMGEPVKIDNMARHMIRLSGLSVSDETNNSEEVAGIEIVYVGLRPGEKLFEELLVEDDAMPTAHPKILRAKEKSLSQEEINKTMDAVSTAIETEDIAHLATALEEIVEEYVIDSLG